MIMKLWTSASLVSGIEVGLRGQQTFQLHHSPHGLVDGANSFTGKGALFPLEDGKTNGDNEVGPAPEGEVPAERENTIVQRFRAEPAVCEIRSVEREEYGE
jgi:hypothetical protein